MIRRRHAGVERSIRPPDHEVGARVAPTVGTRPAPGRSTACRHVRPAARRTATRIPKGTRMADPATTSPADHGTRHDDSLLGEQDLHLFNEGTHLRLYDVLGSHLDTVDGVDGAHFAVWAPNASGVSVVGDWNGWDGTTHRLQARDGSGIWEGFVPDVVSGSTYKYRIFQADGSAKDKFDPYAAHTETPPIANPGKSRSTSSRARRAITSPRAPNG